MVTSPANIKFAARKTIASPIPESGAKFLVVLSGRDMDLGK
jgi:hypothetical protein